MPQSEPSGVLAATLEAPVRCPAGNPVRPGSYTCYFCRSGPLHSGSEPCKCSTNRPKVTQYATLCPTCATCVDTLMENTPLGAVARRLIHEADMRGRPSSD